MVRGISSLLGAARKLRPQLRRTIYAKKGVYCERTELKVGRLKLTVVRDNMPVLPGIWFGILGPCYGTRFAFGIVTKRRSFSFEIKYEKGGGREEEHH